MSRTVSEKVYSQKRNNSEHFIRFPNRVKVLKDLLSINRVLVGLETAILS